MYCAHPLADGSVYKYKYFAGVYLLAYFAVKFTLYFASGGTFCRFLRTRSRAFCVYDFSGLAKPSIWRPSLFTLVFFPFSPLKLLPLEVGLHLRAMAAQAAAALQEVSATRLTQCLKHRRTLQML